MKSVKVAKYVDTGPIQTTNYHQNRITRAVNTYNLKVKTLFMALIFKEQRRTKSENESLRTSVIVYFEQSRDQFARIYGLYVKQNTPNPVVCYVHLDYLFSTSRWGRRWPRNR